VGIVLCLPVMDHLGHLAISLGGDVSRQIAMTHTLFNVALALVFFPFISLGVKLVRNWIPENASASPFAFLYLDPRTLSSPELALAQAQREILRLADTVEQMVERSIHLFEYGEQREVEQVKAMDQVVDFLNKGIKLYLTRLSQKEMTPEQVQKEFELLLRTNDLENIGDIVDKNILELVRKNIKKGYTFSREGWNEITTFHNKVVECLRISTAYFTSHDRALAAKLLVHHQEIEDMMLDLSQLHMQRLHQGVKESLDTTSVHLDLLGNLQRIADLSVNFTRVHGIKHHAAELSAITLE
jgi:phosphate:Na+ symporter